MGWIPDNSGSNLKGGTIPGGRPGEEEPCHGLETRRMTRNGNEGVLLWTDPRWGGDIMKWHRASMAVWMAVICLCAPLSCSQSMSSCEQWNTKEFFETATADDLTACLADGADPIARNNGGYTPLHWAAHWNENPAVIEALLAAGADPMARTKDGDTPLHLAVAHTKVAAIKVLLDAGSDAAIRNAAGRTPWDLAQANEKLKQTDSYWRLNEARFKAPPVPSSRVDAPRLISACSSDHAAPSAHGLLVPGKLVWRV